MPRRNLVLHEYQAAELLSQYNIPLPRGSVAYNAKEAYVIARKFGNDYRGRFVIKSQVQTLQRTNGVFKQSGLRGGVHTVDSVEDVVHFAEKMCGKNMTTSLM